MENIKPKKIIQKNFFNSFPTTQNALTVFLLYISFFSQFFSFIYFSLVSRLTHWGLFLKIYRMSVYLLMGVIE